MRTVIFLLTVFLVGCQSSKVSQLAHNSSATAVIQKVEGQADIRLGGRAWEPAQVGQSLQTGDEARTGADGQIDFHLGKHGGVLSLMPGSTLQFEQLGPKSPDDSVQAVVNLPTGRITGDTLKLPGATKIVVKTPGGVTEIP